MYINSQVADSIDKAGRLSCLLFLVNTKEYGAIPILD